MKAKVVLADLVVDEQGRQVENPVGDLGGLRLFALSTYIPSYKEVDGVLKHDAAANQFE